jgi:ATPase family AAA domain-containing protein 3A/B
MLYHTGTASCKFMLVIATNRPGDLDSAIIDRMDEQIEFALPDLLEREGLVRLYGSDVALGELGDGVCQKVAKHLSTFSGREISKLFLSIKTNLYANGLSSIPNEDWLMHVVNEKVKEHVRGREMMRDGYKFDDSRVDRGMPNLGGHSRGDNVTAGHQGVDSDDGVIVDQSE